jgi:hypothetical protein
MPLDLRAIDSIARLSSGLFGQETADRSESESAPTRTPHLCGCDRVLLALLRQPRLKLKAGTSRRRLSERSTGFNPNVTSVGALRTH